MAVEGQVLTFTVKRYSNLKSGPMHDIVLRDLLKIFRVEITPRLLAAFLLDGRIELPTIESAIRRYYDLLKKGTYSV